MYRFLDVTLVSFVLVATAAPAFAQAPRPERPYRGLFASGMADAGQSLKARVSLSAGYDDDLSADATGSQGLAGEDPLSTRRGVLGTLGGSLAYQLTTDKFGLGASGATTARYYPSLENQVVRVSQARIAASVRLREGTSLSGSASAIHQPYSFGAIFPTLFSPQIGDSPAPNPDLAVTADSYLALEGDTALSHRFSRRASGVANYQYRVAEIPGESGQFVYQNAMGQFSYTVGRGLGLRAGYGYGETQYSSLAARVVHHQIDAGVDYNRALSFSRRTTLSFGTGSSSTKVRGTYYFTATGSARLNHEMGRSWNASFAYGRHVMFVETWQEPVLSDAITAAVGGLLTRRLQFMLAANAARGRGFSINSGAFESYYGTAALSFAVARFMNLDFAYSYYQHHFAEGSLLPPGALRMMDRQSVRAGVSLWAPLFHRARRVDAAR